LTVPRGSWFLTLPRLSFFCELRCPLSLFRRCFFSLLLSIDALLRCSVHLVEPVTESFHLRGGRLLLSFSSLAVRYPRTFFLGEYTRPICPPILNVFNECLVFPSRGCFFFFEFATHVPFVFKKGRRILALRLFFRLFVQRAAARNFFAPGDLFFFQTTIRSTLPFTWVSLELQSAPPS